jgi:hypothetical protein
VQLSTNGGQTWSPPIYFVPPAQYRAWPSIMRPLSDGRLVLMAGCWLRDNAPVPAAEMVKTMFISNDEGRTWGAPIPLMPMATGVCEESDFVELPSGDLMWIHRTEHYSAAGDLLYSDRMESISQKTGNTFVSQPATTLSWPHSGYPCELLTREGVILDLCTGASHWSADNGVTWHDLLLPDGQPLATYYYPKAIQADDGTIVVVGHLGSDNVYGTYDQAIYEQTFRLNVVVPEPSTAVLFGIAAASLLAYVWRKRGRKMGRP